MPRFRIAIPAVVAVDIEAADAEAALREATRRQRWLADTLHHPAAHGEPLEEYGAKAALWASGNHLWKPEIWDMDVEEPMPTSDPRHPYYDGPGDEYYEGLAERVAGRQEAERERLRDAGR